MAISSSDNQCRAPPFAAGEADAAAYVGVAAVAAVTGVARSTIKRATTDELLAAWHRGGYAIRFDDPALRNVPIIGLTADTTAEQRARCEAAGMNSVAIKPLTTSNLAALLGGVLAWPARAAAQPAPRPALQAMPFDSQIFLALFDRADAEGAAWLGAYLNAARDQAVKLTSMPAAALAQVAHKPAGASFSVGAMKLGAAARALELAALAPAPTAPLAPLVAAVQAEFAAAEAAIAIFLAAAPVVADAPPA